MQEFHKDSLWLWIVSRGSKRCLLKREHGRAGLDLMCSEVVKSAGTIGTLPHLFFFKCAKSAGTIGTLAHLFFGIVPNVPAQLAHLVFCNCATVPTVPAQPADPAVPLCQTCRHNWHWHICFFRIVPMPTKSYILIYMFELFQLFV